MIYIEDQQSVIILELKQSIAMQVTMKNGLKSLLSVLVIRQQRNVTSKSKKSYKIWESFKIATTDKCQYQGTKGR